LCAFLGVLLGIALTLIVLVVVRWLDRSTDSTKRWTSEPPPPRSTRGGGSSSSRREDGDDD
jgi:hypothetical protein